MKFEEIKRLCSLDNALSSADFIADLRRAHPIINRFCKKYNVELISVDLTSEATDRYFKLEPIYTFSDNLGGYLLTGLRESLK